MCEECAKAEQCEVCKLEEQGLSHRRAIRAFKEREKRMMVEYGFYIHLVPLDNGYANIHTHGMEQSVKCKDVQITYNMPQNQVLGLMHAIYNFVKEHGALEENKIYDILQVPIKFVVRKEMGREVFRMVGPDKKGKWPGEEGCDEGIVKGVDIET